MEIEEPTSSIKKPADVPKIPEPPPVRLVAIADMRLEAPDGLEANLTEFYVGLLKFERDPDDTANIAFKAEKFRLVYKIVDESAPRDDYRPIMIETPLFTDFVQALFDREIEFEWQKGTAAGVEVAFLQDPAGHWVSVGPIREVR